MVLSAPERTLIHNCLFQNTSTLISNSDGKSLRHSDLSLSSPRYCDDVIGSHGCLAQRSSCQIRLAAFAHCFTGRRKVTLDVIMRKFSIHWLLPADFDSSHLVQADGILLTLRSRSLLQTH